MNKAAQARLPTQEIKFGFDSEMIVLQLDQIIPLKQVSALTHETVKYKQIMASIKEVGIIEPPVVCRDRAARGRYLLLDGHLRIKALKELSVNEVTCLISTDDEAFTYNKHVNRLAPIQEYRMIARAVKRGVSEEKLARALSMDVQAVIRKLNLLNGICEEAADMLKDKMVPGGIFPLLRRLKPVRQIEVAGLMNEAGIYTVSYMKALLAATPPSQLVPGKKKHIKGLDDEKMAHMEQEMASIQREYQLIEENYGTDILNLTIAKSYLLNILANTKVVRYLTQYHPEILSQFQKIAELSSLSTKAGR
ncbi:MAG TPA: plasmid partitioning protein RepB C-terminal domain-containing protein [Rickettsiales bacterium]|nr:plasmid partitioning protein RepB C-terminal domain-containing protein [Rickettsiales bacterium]